MKQEYVAKKFQADTLRLIDTIDSIIEEYQAQGFVLTVRQLYYQLVARAVIPNTLQEYKRAAGIINDAKLAGILDWDAIEDRTREFVRRSRWTSGADILNSAAQSFHMDMWQGQTNRCFVIIEKEALVGVLEPTCRDLDIPILAARGYPSGSVLREFVIEDVLPAMENGQEVVIFHLGDHDPSGIDMSRDLEDRIKLFAEWRSFTFERIALNMPQINALKPPENPAKSTDARYADYRRKYGDKSWELDALSPAYLANLVRTEVEPYINRVPWKHREREILKVNSRIKDMAGEL